MKSFPKTLLFLVLVCFAGILTNGCDNHQLVNFTEKPDVIVIYSNGSEKKIDKSDSRFSKIVSYAENRFGANLSTVKMACDKEKMEQIKHEETVIELKYSSEQTFYFSARPINYTSIILPLTGEYKNLGFFDRGTGNYNGPLGDLSKPDKLLNLIK